MLALCLHGNVVLLGTVHGCTVHFANEEENYKEISIHMERWVLQHN